MKRLWCLSASALLLAWSPAAEARSLPDRAQVERAVNLWFACRGGAECGSPVRRRLTRSRCRRLPVDQLNPGRILCVFSGVNLSGGGRPGQFRGDCVYLVPARRGWRVSSFPDADMCG
jgi:hypothetical protein